MIAFNWVEVIFRGRTDEIRLLRSYVDTIVELLWRFIGKNKALLVFLIDLFRHSLILDSFAV